MQIDNIIIGERHRKAMGDIESLARSIEEVGLLHPIVVRTDGTLIAGQRRVLACQSLGWTEIPATIVDLESIARGEQAENAERKDFTPSEAVAIGKALEPLEREAARERERTHNESGYVKVTDAGSALDKVASAVGMSRPTYTKAQHVVEAAESEPELYGDLVDKMDSTGNVHGAHKALVRRQRHEAKSVVPKDLPDATDRYQLIHMDMRVADILPDSVNVIITDPPYSREYLSLYGDLAKLAASTLKPGGSLLVMCGQSYLPEIISAMTPHIRYHWTLAYLTPGGQSAQLWQRKVNTFWKPVLWFINGEYSGDWIGDVARSAVNDNDKRFHEWGQSESGMADLIKRFTYPGETILDPFCGAGTTGVVAVQMNRCFIGIDSDEQAIEIARNRLYEVTHA